ncbi:arginase [Clostridium brassicae]|uniref:Arginase n=1 Tax=Clostridium brassicae TaxID=2999072 RepID=A0ABT4D6G5_9CLOT|nr:arginase [Clostridium brassicae]MCY6957273.1 arginase [Clostridium brassicae]
MRNILLSIDWDYFVKIKREWCGSYIENDTNLKYRWYKRYLDEKRKGINIEKKVILGAGVNSFWKKIFKHFNISKKTPLYISDSHKFSYNIGEKYNCKEVYLFDAHSDLGYGGLESLKFEVNCANWLGKLFVENIVKDAKIIYSPYSFEESEDFKEINETFNINYIDMSEIGMDIKVSAIHICRSGAWTPPWMDKHFYKFINEAKLHYREIEKMERKWNLKELNLSDAIMCFINS